ncbi:uncharacterized protein LOC119601549 [Lucilia sericata]|uniref:uncharacterized protein LOC119601549 n=1 Tax=Lucilia sericata TaxID=13632 RepID=UPI0018A87A49|nr:uncharacterized protein LOC119601549 [Lucilia sericata]
MSGSDDDDDYENSSDDYFGSVAMMSRKKVQGNMAKSIIQPAPRGLNLIAEYTLNYELPTDFYVFQKKQTKTTKHPIPTMTTKSPYTKVPYYQHYDMIVPYNHDYYFKIHPEYINKQLIQRKHSYSKKKMLQRKCFKRNFYDYNRKLPSICLNRAKRNEEVWSLHKLTISQRMFYDLIEKWSLLHGFLPRYCFMRTLCESSELLLPYGYSLLHDIIHILLRYTKPWVFHHKIFGRSLRQTYPIDECAKLYGPHCRVSWLDFITNVVHGTRAVDFMR